MSWQQIAMIVIWAVGGTLYLIKHGEDQGEYNFFWWVLGFGLHFVILYSSGFFE
jgi:hypothetical protein